MGSCFRPKRIDPITGKKVPYKKHRIVWDDEHGKRCSAMAFNDKAASKALLATKEKEVERRKAGLSTVDHEQAKRPLGEIIDEYIADLKRQGRSEVHWYCQRGFLRRLAAWEEWTALGHVRHATMSQALVKLAERPYAPKTVNHYRKAYRQFLEWCIDMRLIGENPVIRVKSSEGRERPAARRPPTEAEWHRWMSVCPRRRAVLYLVAGLTGLRKKELRLLERRDVNLDADPPRLELRADATKAKRADVVPLLPDVVPTFRKLCAGLDPLDPVFPRFPCNLTIRRDLKRADLYGVGPDGRRVNFHSLRYYFCCLLGRKLPIQVVRLLMRHADIGTTCRVYLLLGLTDISDAVLRLPSLATIPEISGAREASDGTMRGDKRFRRAPTGAHADP